MNKSSTNSSVILEKQKSIKQLNNQILLKIKEMFKYHQIRVEKDNQQRAFGGKNSKNDKSDKVYKDIGLLQAKLQQGIFTNIKQSQMLKKQRKQFFQNKIEKFVTILKELHSKKNIKIKINQNIQTIITQATTAAEQASSILKRYEKQGRQWCGKSYDLKPAVEKTLTSLCQFSFLFENLCKFQSITNDSVKQIYIAAQFQEKQFNKISDSLIKLWPKPIIQKIQVQSPPVIITQKVQGSRLDQAHQLYFGFGRPLQPLKAIKLYQQQIKQKKSSCSSALNALGQIYLSGKYIKKDLRKSLKYYKQSSKQNNSQGLYKVGWFLQKGIINLKQQFQGKYNNRQAQIRAGIDYYQKAAKGGHLDAITDLGFIYQNGIKDQYGQEIIPPFPATAIDYYRKAKKQQFPRALNNLGSFIVKNQNTIIQQKGQTIEKGIKYLMRAKQLYYSKAYLNLGKCYQNGLGVNQNLDMARAIFLQGIQIGQQSCRMQYIKTFLCENIQDDKTMIKLSEICKEVLLLDHSNPQANYFMGLFAEKGIGTQINKQSSFYYIQRAAKRDYAPAIVKLGDFYYSGYYVQRNQEFAKKLYEKAWTMGNSQALVNLGVMKEKGLCQDESDLQTAHSYYQKAAKMGNLNGILLLGLQKNHSHQNDYLIKAAELGSVDAAKLLNRTQAKLVPKKAKVSTTYSQLMKQRANMYCKQNQCQGTQTKSFSMSKRQMQ